LGVSDLSTTRSSKRCSPSSYRRGTRNHFPVKIKAFSALKNGFSAQKNDLSAGIKDFSALRNDFSAGIKGFAVRKTRFSALGNGFSAVRNNGKVNKYGRLRFAYVSRRGDHILLYEHRSLLSRSLRLILTIFRLCYFFRRKKTLKLTLKMLVFDSEHITQC